VGVSTPLPTTTATSFDELIGRALAKFFARFGARPRFAAAAPGRINLIGEHTDYNDGFVLPMAIDRWAVIVADFAPNNQSVFVAADLAREFTLDLRTPLAPSPTLNAWVNHLTGVVHQFKNRGTEAPNLNLLLTSTVPIGAGLASSAAIEVAMATLIEQITGSRCDPLERAKLCQRAEHEFVGTPCGIMDMLVACAAVEGAAMFIDCRSLQITTVPLPPFGEASVLIVDTGVRHDLAAGMYAQRRCECAEAARQLGVRFLRDATAALLAASALPDVLLHRATHVVTENMRTVLAAAALRTGDLEQLGDLMFASHESLSRLFEVSCAELDLIVEAAGELRGEGVFGARMTGGGFGGCAIVLCRSGRAADIQVNVCDRFQRQFERSPATFVVRAVGSATPVALP
jgi:galactokinase